MQDIDFMPHGHCYFWQPEILWSHAISDAIIAAAYIIIPVFLYRIFFKRQDFKYVWMVNLFGVFILGCGITHVFDVINIWKPFYVTDSIVRIITATASIGTAVVLAKVTPNIIRLPTYQAWLEVNENLRRRLAELQEKDQTIEAIRKLEDLAEAVPQIMWASDQRGKLIYINNKWKEYTGHSYQESDNDAFRKYLSAFIHPDDLLEAYERWSDALTRSEKFEKEFRLLGEKGHYEWFLCRSLPMKNAHGKVTKWFGTFTNIHASKVQYEQLIKSNQDLDAFVYSSSHDLRSPINNMEGILNMLQEHGEPRGNASQELLQMMQASLSNLNKVVDALSDATQLSRQIPEETDEIDIEVLLDSLSEEFAEQASATEASISKKLDLQKVQFSPRNMRSLLSNLLSNALKYAHPERKLSISVRTYRQEGLFVLEVEDNGIGIPKENQPKVFDLFNRLHHDGRGAGVGLFLVDRIAKDAKGHVELESEVEKGSIFRIFLPILRSDK